MKDLISVIVPIYKVEELLPRCINSLLNQTHKNLEIILVNYGSPDKCGEICDQYAKKDKRIKVIHKENGGLSDARNCGLKIASGEYIAFVDSDDYIHNKMYEILLDNLKKNHADMSICMIKNVVELNPIEDESTLKQNIKCYSKNECHFNLFNELYLPTEVAWNKIYKKELWDNLEYPVGKLHEDEYVIHHLIERCNKVVYTNLELYYYYNNQNGITKKFNVKRLDAIEAFEDRKQFYKNIKNAKLYNNACLAYLKVLGINYVYVKMYLKDNFLNKELKVKFRENYKELKERENIPLINKIQFFMMINFPIPYHYIKTILKNISKRKCM